MLHLNATTRPTDNAVITAMPRWLVCCHDMCHS